MFRRPIITTYHGAHVDPVLDTKTTEDGAAAAALQGRDMHKKLSVEVESSDIQSSSQPESDEGGDNMNIPSPATTPHRALTAFNESVEYASAEDLRDMLPEEGTWRIALTPTAETSEAEDEQGEEPEEELKVKVVDHPSTPQRQQQQEHSPTSQKQQQEHSPTPQKQQQEQEEAQLPVGKEECLHVVACPVDITVEGVPLAGQGRDSRYEYGPTHFAAGKRRRVSLLWRLTGSDPSSARGMRPCSPKASAGMGYGHRSVVEVMEAWLLALYRPADEDRSEGSSGLVGVLSYVLRALLDLYYHIFVYLPLQVLQSVARFLWAATSTALALVYVGSSWLVSAYLWLLFLPVRLTQRCLLALWQCTLNLATALFNVPNRRRDGDHKGSGGRNPAGELFLETGADVGACPHKDVIPTA